MESEMKTYSTVIGVILICTLNPLLMVFGVITLIRKRLIAPTPVKIFCIVSIVYSAVILIYRIYAIIAEYINELMFFSSFSTFILPDLSPHILSIAWSVNDLLLCVFVLMYLPKYLSAYKEVYPDHFSYDP